MSFPSCVGDHLDDMLDGYGARYSRVIEMQGKIGNDRIVRRHRRGIHGGLRRSHEAEPGTMASGSEIQWSPDGEFLAMGNGNLHLLRIRDGEELTLALFEGDDGADAIVVANAAFAGKPSLARCVVGASAPITERPGLLADFFAHRPLAASP